ncbi:adenylate/guanylate cyclase domain-containing protein [Muricauda sp. 2012CJ35-5]|uniref:Adenylate/guanylate cyclase domain-containing protein n=1 Tax=Flagellimonas spongiicola TaxID=2942208 RepID=A0ABT0PN27_9FLAO|nr:adenylate/guanylate cyclase domain-containing protein [Allomuricauda spongiicola]MCL6272641.1 adenylate/guanylate cyclase domain-containing protein [Allomuricauda spongiicola]
MGISMVFGLSYNYFFYSHTFIEFFEAGSIGVILGLLIGVLEEFVFKKAFHKISSLAVTIIRSLLYSLLISTILALVLAIENVFKYNTSYSEAVIQYLIGPEYRRDFLFSLSFIAITLFLLQIIHLIGRANFLRLFFGMYRQPREVSRLFMFLDLKGSTSIAEKLGNKMYSTFIRDFFNDISDAIILFKGEIYQYAGDEIILVWPIGKNNLNAILCFFKMVEIIKKKHNEYLTKYGIIPEFKAGIHTGKVIVTTVGKQKKEIVYHGDVLNTTARIEGKCNELQQKLLVSENILPFLQKEKDYYIKVKGEIQLKGKSQKLPLYGVQLATQRQFLR